MNIKKDFINRCIISILNQFDRQTKPLDVFLSHFFRAHRSIGSKKRKEICEKIYFMIRWRSLLDHFCTKPTDWEKKLAILDKGFSPEKHLQNKTIPHHTRLSFPKPYHELLAQQYSKDEIEEICLISNGTAPTTIRANLLKTTREELFARLNRQYKVSLCSLSNMGIQFEQKANFFAMEEFKEGLFEIQDEGSQLLADLIEANPQQKVLDYCAGSGGKTLGFAHKLNGKSQIYLYDIRPLALKQAKKRLFRAGIQNAQLITNDKQWEPLKKSMNWILLDVPCSGSGTLRRNPDLKWKFKTDQMSQLIQEQRNIFEKSLPYLKKGGSIVYSTCSLFQEENEKQIEYFLQHFPFEIDREPSFWLPQKGGRDGFFGAVLKGKGS